MLLKSRVAIYVSIMSEVIFYLNTTEYFKSVKFIFICQYDSDTDLSLSHFV
jgi:hypothetical protein